MKIRIHLNELLVALISSACLLSCNGLGDFSDVQQVNYPEDKNSVSESIVDRYITAVKGLPSTKASQTDVTPILEQGDTVMYLVNYPDGGWELLSADKRIPTRLMVSEEGSMSLEEMENHPGVSILLNEMRHKIHAVKQSDQEEPVTDVGILWDKVAPANVSTKSDNINWVLYDTETVYLDSTDVNHLITTAWGQGEVGSKWYNRYVPYLSSAKTNTTDGRCPVGSVPVAVGQLLGYLHNKINLTTTCTFSECTCNTYIAAGATSTKYGSFIPNVSTNMTNQQFWRLVLGTYGTSEDQQKCASVLLAYLGYLLDVTYRYDANGRWTDGGQDAIVDALDETFGVACTKTEWDLSTAVNQIVNSRMPVIVSASQSNNYTPALYHHTWLVDGYYCRESVINYYYVGFEQPSTDEPIYKTEQVAGETEQFFRMNWGMGSEGNANAYYVNTSEWTYNNGVNPYNTNIEMIYGFTKN